MIARVAAAVVLAGALVLGTSGCTLFAQQRTAEAYEPSDGSSVDVGTIKVRNAILLSEDGNVASLLTTVVNSGDRGQTVNFQVETADGKTTISKFVNGNATESFGATDQEQLLFEGLDTIVGGLVKVYVQYGNEPGETILVPVLDGTHPEYAEYLPASE